MSDGAISQDEIDALLSGVDMGGLSANGTTFSTPSAHIDTEILKKFAGNIKDTLASNLGTMTGVEVSAGEPTVEAISRDQLLSKIPEVVVAVMADFSAGINGDHLFVFAPEFAQKLVSLINKEENAELDDMALSVISEVVSQHSGSEITELSKDGKLPGLATNPPEAVHQPKPMVRIPQNKFALFTYPLTIDGQPYTLWEAIGGQAAEAIGRSLGGGEVLNSAANMNAGGMAQMGNMPGANPAMMGGMQMPQQNMMMGGMQMPQQNMMMGANMGMMGGMQMQQPQAQFNTPNVQSLQYPNLTQSMTPSEQGNIGLIMDVYMEMTVELGRTKKTIKEILGMGEGTIIELDKLAGEPVDILVNHKPIAKGEVVVIDENFGVRVTEILPSIEHVTSAM